MVLAAGSSLLTMALQLAWFISGKRERCMNLVLVQGVCVVCGDLLRCSRLLMVLAAGSSLLTAALQLAWYTSRKRRVLHEFWVSTGGSLLCAFTHAAAAAGC
jgi:hypothetical protein